MNAPLIERDNTRFLVIVPENVRHASREQVERFLPSLNVEILRQAVHFWVRTNSSRRGMRFNDNSAKPRGFNGEWRSPSHMKKPELLSFCLLVLFDANALQPVIFARKKRRFQEDDDDEEAFIPKSRQEMEAEYDNPHPKRVVVCDEDASKYIINPPPRPAEEPGPPDPNELAAGTWIAFTSGIGSERGSLVFCAVISKICDMKEETSDMEKEMHKVETRYNRQILITNLEFPHNEMQLVCRLPLCRNKWMPLSQFTLVPGPAVWYKRFTSPAKCLVKRVPCGVPIDMNVLNEL